MAAGGLMRLRPLVAALLGAATGLAGCQRREAPAAARARADAALLRQQIQSMEALVAKAELGGLDTERQIAVGVSEGVLQDLVEASLPPEIVVTGRLRLRVENVQASFRGNRSALVMRARLSSTGLPDAYARVELSGSLKEFAFTEGKLVSGVSILHFSVLESSAGELAADVVDSLVKNHLSEIDAALPPIVVPVRLEEAVTIDGLDEGPVVARAGILPFAIKIANVLPLDGRLWILLEAQAGPWMPLAAAGPSH